MNLSHFSTATIRLARVTYVHPEAQRFEAIFLDTGDYVRDVQVMTPYGGTDFGYTTGVPFPDEEGHDPNMTENDPDVRHIVAVVACLQGMNICLGYLYPQITQMAFTRSDKNRLIERHPSDTYRTISNDGDMDLVHPGGAYIRMGEGESPDALDGRDYDGIWKIKRNKDKSVTITLASREAQMRLTPDGRILLSGAMSIEADAPDIKVRSATTTVESSDQVSVSAPLVDVQGGASIQARAPLVDVRGDAITLESDDMSLAMSAGSAGIRGKRMDVELEEFAKIDALDSVTLKGGELAKVEAPTISLKGITQIDGDIYI